MKKSTVAIVLLIAVLVVSNAWWAYQVLDAGVTYTYQSASLEESQQALSQAVAIINAIGSGDASRERIVAAANKSWSAGEPFEKDGYLWVGRLGLRFSDTGRLVEVTQ
jgi:hypothetical protein